MTGNTRNHKHTVKSHGGLRFNKVSAPSIETLPLAATLRILLTQHQGPPASVIVTEGSHVNSGQPLTASDNLSQVPVHASSSGIISRIDQHCITIVTDGHNTEHHRESGSPDTTISRDQLIKTLHHCGVVGMGGAGFPAAKKIASLSTAANLLLINAAECDPTIHCDDALMQSHAMEIVSGIKIIANACKLDTIVIGFEDNKPKAQAAMKDALDTQDIKADIVIMPSVYPSGAENILAQLCLDQIHLPAQSNPVRPLSENGILSFNVASCFAIHQAVTHGIPLISRITSVVDDQGKIRNYQIPVGTPVAHLFTHMHNNTAMKHRVTSGGQMMSTPLSFDDATVKTSNCIAFSLPDSSTGTTRACIRCGACAEVCPVHLLPQQLHMHATHFNDEALQHYNLANCIECGCCDAVCPSHLPLTASFQNVKQKKMEIQQEKALADLAKQRFEKRQQRLDNKTQLRTRRAAIDKPTLPDPPLMTAASNQDQKKKQLIEAALKRKRNKAKSNQQDRQP